MYLFSQNRYAVRLLKIDKNLEKKNAGLELKRYKRIN